MLMLEKDFTTLQQIKIKIFMWKHILFVSPWEIPKMRKGDSNLTSGHNEAIYKPQFFQ